jgi:hypothetical protein
LAGSGHLPNQSKPIIIPQTSSIYQELKNMSKEKKSNKESKKKPAMTTKEKKAAKRSKNDAKNILNND